MSIEGSSPSSVPTPAPSGILVPLNVILSVSEYLGFRVYRNFIRAIWPNGDEVEEVRAKLWQLSTHQVTAEFLNGQRISVIYNFNPWRTEDEPLLISVKSLAPILAGTGVEVMGQFASVPRLHNYIMKHVHMNQCSNLRYADCLCHMGNHQSLLGRRILEYPVDPCPDGCFHHYCSNHVRFWLHVYLLPAICNSS